MTAIDEEIRPTKPSRRKEVKPLEGDSFPAFVKGGEEPMRDLIKQIYQDLKARNGTDVKVP